MKVAVMGADELAPGEHRVVQVGRRSIGIFRVGDEYHALADHCPHQGGPLCRGRAAPLAVAGAPGEVALDPGRVFVACPWHGWEYDVTTGRSYFGPGEAPVRSYATEVVAVDPAHRARPRALRRRHLRGDRRGPRGCRRHRRTSPHRPGGDRMTTVSAPGTHAPAGGPGRRASTRGPPPAAPTSSTRTSTLRWPAQLPRLARARAGAGSSSAARVPRPPGSTRGCATPASADSGPPRARPAATWAWSASSCSTRSDLDPRRADPAAGPHLGRRAARRTPRRCAARSTTSWSRTGSTAEPRLRASHPHPPRVARPWPPPRSARRAGDPRFGQVLLATGGEPGPSAAAATGRSTRPRPRPGCRSRRTPAGWSSHRGAGWPSFYLEEHAGTATRWPAGHQHARRPRACSPSSQTLQVVCVEGGLAWLPPLMWALDSPGRCSARTCRTWHRPPSEDRPRARAGSPPSRSRSRTIPARPGDRAAPRSTWTDRILFASDYPHWDFDSPGLRRGLFPAALRADHGHATRAALYGLAGPGALRDRGRAHAVDADIHVRSRRPWPTCAVPGPPTGATTSRVPGCACPPRAAPTRRLPPSLPRRPPRGDRCVPRCSTRPSRRGDRRVAVLSCTTAFHCNRNPYYEAALCRAVNDWLPRRAPTTTAGCAARSPSRPGDPEAAVARDPSAWPAIQGSCQVAAAACAGRRAATGNRRFLPVLEAIAEHGLVVGLHAWGRAGTAADHQRDDPHLPGRTTWPRRRSRRRS